MLKRENKTKSKAKMIDLTNFPIYRLFPSIITIIALCAGLTSVRYALDFKWEYSLILLVIAAFLDGMDGRIARYLQVTSDFGAQLDSLADFMNFGVAPAITIYLWTLNSIETRGVGWVFVLVFVVCCAIRLARFNAMLVSEEDKQPWREYFFVGIPAPVGGIMSLLPMVISLEWPELAISNSPKLVGCYMVLVAFAMASRIPTFSIKKLAISHDKVAFLLAIIALVVAALLIKPWATISVLAVCYILSIPCSIRKYRKFASTSKL